MIIPNFLIIGAQKAGTTSLIKYLGEHPDIFVPENKEISNFYDDENYNQRFRHFPYLKYYRNWNGQKYAGNAPVNLLYFSEKTAGRVLEHNRAIKLIAILRNPVARAYSAYWYFVRCGLETESFESALERENKILELKNFKDLSNLTYISHGFYHSQLLHFLGCFDVRQILILLYDDFKKDPEETLKRIYDFLEVKPCIPDGFSKKTYNASSRAKIQSIHSLVFKDHVLKRAYKNMFTESFRYKVRNVVVRKILDKNLEKFSYPPMKASTKQYLLNLFEESNTKLQGLLGRDLQHWQAYI